MVYASDLDRTLIFSHRFLDEHKYNKKIVLVEDKDGKEISYMSELAYNKLQEINNNKDITFIPTTTRSLEEYNRIRLGFKPEWVIAANGGVILHNGEIDKEYKNYTKTYLNPMDIASLSMDLSEFASIQKSPRLVDGCYLFVKTTNEDLFDVEVQDIIDRYKKWSIVRQKNKCYAIPLHISKQVALRWIWNKLNEPYIVASGDSLLDVPMLALADKAYIPDHSDLLKDGVVESGNIVTGGIESPYKTMIYAEGIAKSLADKANKKHK